MRNYGKQLLRAWALCSVLFLFGCGDHPAASADKDLLSRELIAQTWMWQITFEPGLSGPNTDSLGQRWLGVGKDGWASPAWAGFGSQPSALEGRILGEDAEAIELLGELYLRVSCRLAQTPHSYGQHVPEGYVIGRAACVLLGDAEGAERVDVVTAGAKLEAKRAELELLAASHQGRPLSQLVQRVLEVEGESLTYRFFRPEEFSEAAALLRSLSSKGPAEPGSLALRAGTSSWSEQSVSLLPTAEDLLKRQSGAPDLATLEQSAEEFLERLSRSIRFHGGKESPPLEAAEVSLLSVWARRALYRDLGVSLLKEGHGDVALPLLEEAAGSTGRLGPSSARDPVLLAAVAAARYQNNQGLRAADLLRTISREEGWTDFVTLAELVARQEVLPSSTGANLRR